MERSYVSGKPPCIFYQGNTYEMREAAPTLPYKNPGVIFIRLSPLSKGVSAPLVYPRFFSGLMHCHISI